MSVDPTASLLISAAIMGIWTVAVSHSKPYETWASNTAEVWSSGGVAVFLVLTAGFGFGANGENDVLAAASKNKTPGGGLILTAFIVSIGVPCVLLSYELLLAVPWVARKMPKHWLTPTPEELISLTFSRHGLCD